MTVNRSHTGRNATVDRATLHRLLWSRTDGAGRVRIHQAHLAEDLGVTKFTVSRIIREFLIAGRLVKIGAAKTNIGTYAVADPSTWSDARSLPAHRCALYTEPQRGVEESGTSSGP